MITHWKVIVEEIHFGGNIEGRPKFILGFPKKRHLGPQTGSGSFRTRKTAKNSKLPKLPEKNFEPVGKGGWPPIFTWINPPSLGSNGLHCIYFPHQMRKFLLNLAPGEPLALVQKLPCFDDLIKLDHLLSSALDLCVHNLITRCMLYAIEVGLSYVGVRCSATSEFSNNGGK
jgi:hypothetical protein